MALSVYQVHVQITPGPAFHQSSLPEIVIRVSVLLCIYRGTSARRWLDVVSGVSDRLLKVVSL